MVSQRMWHRYPFAFDTWILEPSTLYGLPALQQMPERSVLPFSCSEEMPAKWMVQQQMLLVSGVSYVLARSMETKTGESLICSLQAPRKSLNQ